jgi:hypothetical protein
MFLKLFLLIMRGDRTLYQVVKKNLLSHEARNTKTAMMFTVALSFLIFAGSTFDLIGNLVTSQLVGVLGSDVYITSLLSPKNFLDERALIKFLEEQRSINGTVTSYGFVTSEMTDILNKIGTGKARFHLGSASGFNEAEVRLYGMQENYLQIVNSDYYMPNEIQKGLDLP